MTLIHSPVSSRVLDTRCFGDPRRGQEAANQTVQPTGASRVAQRQIERQRRLAPVADLHVSGSMLQHVLQRVREWEHLGTRSDSSGSRLVAHTPRDFPQAYLHTLFAPLSAGRWKSCGLSLPGQLQALYIECNGLSLFAGALSIYGMREHYHRDLSAQFQPFDLATHHDECVRSFHPGAEQQFGEPVFFGGYNRDGSHLLTTPYSPVVYRLLRGSTRPVNEWPDLQTFLDTEYDRLDALFTRSGYPREKALPTTPDEQSR
jgi:hypothetical protein